MVTGIVVTIGIRRFLGVPGYRSLNFNKLIGGVNVMSRINLIGVALVQLLFGYEFLDSGWNKLFSGSFPAGLADNLKDMLQGQSGWYVNFANSVVMPHSVLFGYLVEWGEFLAGIGIIASALYFMLNKSENKTQYTIFTVVSIASLVGAIFMSLNFWISAGAPSPILGLNDPNGEGVTIDIFGPLLSVVLIWWNVASYGAIMSVQKGSVTAELPRHQEARAS